MAQCAATTRTGERCKNEALPGSEFCRVHRKEETAVVILTQPRRVAIRYVGKGSYYVAGFEFTPERPVHEVPERLAEFLLDTEPELFVLEE